jgi:hypothetical protein
MAMPLVISKYGGRHRTDEQITAIGVKLVKKRSRNDGIENNSIIHGRQKASKAPEIPIVSTMLRSPLFPLLRSSAGLSMSVNVPGKGA